MQKCYANQKDHGVCVQRQGQVLSKDEYDDIHSLPDKDVCRHKDGRNCIFAGRDIPEKKTEKGSTFDSFFD